MKRASLSACALVVLFGACNSSSSDSPDTAIPVTKSDTGASPTVDTGVGADTTIIQKNDTGLSDTLTPAVDTGVGADTTPIQKNDTGLSDAVTPAVDVSSTLAETGGTSLDAGRDLGIAPKVDALDAAKDTAVDTTLAVDSGTSPPDSSTTTCGASGQACCAAPADSCNADLTCLAGASCSCAKGIFGSYIIRADGVVLQMPTTPTGAQTPVLDASTAQPLTGAVSGFDGLSSGLGLGVGCTVKGDGTVWCWRSVASGNSSGSLGNGALDSNGATFRATQVLVSANTPLTDVKSIDLTSTCAVTNGGNLYCWGDLTWAVNKGTTLRSGYAQAITTDGATPLGKVIQSSVGGWSPCALVAGSAANEVWCWGYNGHSNLGTGDTNDRQYPTKILGFTNPTKVVGNWGATGEGWGGHCAIDGTNVRCWGYNAEGECGVGNSNSPVSVPTLVKLADATTAFTEPLDLYAGRYRMCALRSGGTLWCWGSGYKNYAGNLGYTNVVAAGDGESLEYLTNDGLYHAGTITISPKCGSLQ